MFCTRPEAAGKRGHCQPFFSSWALHKTQKHTLAGELTVMCPSQWISPDHVTGIKGWPLSPPCGSWQSSHIGIIQGMKPTGEMGMGAHVCDSFQHTNSVSLPACICPRHRGLQKLTSPCSSHDKYERFENPDQGVTNRITCCLHLVVIIRALMTREELIEMKITPRWVRCARGSAWTLNGCLEW